MTPNQPGRGVALAADTRGLTTVEYAVVLVLVTLGGALAVAAIGAPLIVRLRVVQALIGLPFP